jgi:peptidoglycan/xylan/chitin deacetylase (PgdA/CDA1 family)
MEQLKCMARNGMHIGSHGYHHRWLNRMSSEEQEAEIDQSLEFLSAVGAPLENWSMCYPYGGFNDDTIRILKMKNCALAFTTQVGIAPLSHKNTFVLPRLDTNDFPKDASAEPNEWFQKAVARRE